jgi:hypothetical protein
MNQVRWSIQPQEVCENILSAMKSFCQSQMSHSTYETN